MKTFIFAHTTMNRAIVAYRFENTGPETLILGGVHGNESEGVTLALAILDRALQTFDLKLNLTVVPMLNLDGVLAGTRLNGRGVDLNRNLPTRDWTTELLNPRYPPGPHAASEPENQALIHWLDLHPPQMIFSLHSWNPVLNVNGDCLAEAETLHRWLGYPITREIGYSTPGCLGTYCGLERNMPTLTYEVERGLPASQIVRIHTPALWEALKISEGRLGQRGN